MEVELHTPYIKLDSLLKFSGLSESGSHAKMLIQEGNVFVNGKNETARGKKIFKGDIVKVFDIVIEVV